MATVFRGKWLVALALCVCCAGKTNTKSPFGNRQDTHLVLTDAAEQQTRQRQLQPRQPRPRWAHTCAMEEGSAGGANVLVLVLTTVMSSPHVQNSLRSWVPEARKTQVFLKSWLSF